MKLGKRTRRLLREAIVLAFVDGAWWAMSHDYETLRADFPKDSQIVAGVMRSATTKRDLYPLLSRVEAEGDDGAVVGS